MPCGLRSWVLRIIRNSDASCARRRSVQSALKILCRQCSQLACANIISSTSVGLRSSAVKRVDQVVDLVVAQRQAQRAVGRFQRGPPPAEHVDAWSSGCGSTCAKRRRRPRARSQDRFGHPVVQQRRSALASGVTGAGQVVGVPRSMRRTAVQAAVARDVGGLRRPGRDGAEARDDHDQARARWLGRRGGPYSSSRSRSDRSAGVSGRAASTRCQKHVAATRTAVERVSSSRFSFSTRNARARGPRGGAGGTSDTNCTSDV